MARTFGAYLGDSLKIFLVPVSTISRAAERNLPLPQALLVLLLLAFAAEALRVGLGVLPGGSSAAHSLTQSVLDIMNYVGFFLVALLIMFMLSTVFGGKGNLRQLFSAKLDLASAVLAGFLLAFVFKAAIAVFYLGVTTGSAGLLINMGEQIGFVALGLIVGVYGIIVLRMGGGLSWPLAALAGLIHFALMVGLYGAYSIYVLRDDLSAVQNLLQS